LVPVVTEVNILVGLYELLYLFALGDSPPETSHEQVLYAFSGLSSWNHLSRTPYNSFTFSLLLRLVGAKTFRFVSDDVDTYRDGQ